MTVDPVRNEAEVAQGTLTTIGQPFYPPPGLYGPKERWDIVTPSGDIVGIGYGALGYFTKSVDPTGVTTQYLALWGDGRHGKADDAPPGQGPQP